MLTARSITCCSYSILCINTHRRFQPSSPYSRFLLAASQHKHNKYQFLGNQRLEIFNTSMELHHASNNRFLLAASQHKHNKYQFLGNQRLDIFNTSMELHHARNNRCMTVYNGVDPGPVLPSDPGSPGSWKLWIVGMIITVILPFWGNKWWPLLKLKDRIESVVETAEELTDVVEKVAEEVEKVAEEIADHSPEGGKLKKTAMFVENVAKETAKDAHMAGEVLDKVEEVGKDAESLIETVIDQANEITKEAKDQH